MVHAVFDAGLCDLMEKNAFDLIIRILQFVRDMCGNRLSFSVGVGRDEDLF